MKRDIELSEKRRVSVYVRNHEDGPSDYYRVIQYTNMMNRQVCVHDALSKTLFRKNLDMQNGIKKKSFQLFLFVIIYIKRIWQLVVDINNKIDVIIVQREIFPHVIGPVAATLIKSLFRKGNLIWDFDDDIFSNSEVSKKERKILEQYSKRIVVTSDYLAGLLSTQSHQKIIVLPTTDGFYKNYNIENVANKRDLSYDHEIKMVWTGTSSNLPNVESILSYLDETAEKLKEFYHKDLVLIVVCNQELEQKTLHLKIRNVQWTRRAAEEAIAEAHVGIMPLKETKYALGKGGFKLIQYISMRLPVVASGVGFNKEIVTKEIGYLIEPDKNEKWVNAIIDLANDKDSWLEKGDKAFQKYTDVFSTDHNFEIWETMVKDYARRKNGTA